MTKRVKSRVIDSFQAQEGLHYETDSDPDSSGPQQTLVFSGEWCARRDRGHRGSLRTGQKAYQRTSMHIRGVPLGLVVDGFA